MSDLIKRRLSLVRRWMPVLLINVLGFTVFGEDTVPPEATSRHSGLRVMVDQRYSDNEGKAGLCDVYTPNSQPPAAGFPLILVIHGGGWMSGDKWTLEGYSRRLAESGFVAITVNYRLAPTHQFPAQVDDIRMALLWAKQNASRWSVDPNRIGVFGYSAGGHLSALVASLADEPIAVQAAASDWDAIDPRWQELPKIHAVCAGGPPCDFRGLPIDNRALAYFLGGSRREKPKAYVAASPIVHTSSSDPVTQIIHGDKDLIVPITGAKEYHAAQLAAGIDSRLQVMPRQGHLVTFLNPETSTKMIEFFQQTLLTK